MAATTDGDYRKLANALPQIIWTCDAQGRLEWVNDRWMELTGLSEEESLQRQGRPRRRASRRSGGDAAAFGNALATVEPVRDASTGSGTGRARIASTSAASCPSATRTARSRAGWPRRSTCTIAAQAEEALRASERRFETVFHLNPQPTAITRFSDGTYLNVNDAFLKLTGFSRDEVVGKTASSWAL